MKIVCDRNVLIKNLNIANKAITGRSPQSILKCILLSVTDTAFKMFASDLKLSIETKAIDCELPQAGKIAVDSKMFTDIIKKLPDGKVTITTDSNNIITINSQKAEFKIHGQESDEYPEFPMTKKENKFDIKGSILSDMINKTIFAVSTSDIKPVFKGELFEISNNTLNVVALDGYKIAQTVVNFENPLEDRSLIISGKDLGEVASIVSDEDIVSIYNDEEHCLIDTDSATIVTRLINGNFLDYKNVFNIDENTTVTINKNNLVPSLDRALLFSNSGKLNSIKLNIEDGIIKIKTNTELGESYDEIEIEKTGEDLDIAFNPRYLLDVIKHIDEEKIIMQFNNSLSPCVIKGMDNEKSKFLILPLRLK